MAIGVISSACNDDMNALIKRIYYTYKWTTSIAVNGYLAISASKFKISTPSGYIPIGVARFTTGTAACIVTNVNPNATGDTTAMTMRNKHSSAVSGYTAGIAITYMREDYAVSLTAK